MKRKKIVGISIALGVIVGLVIIVAMVFTLNKIDVQLTATFQDASRSRLFKETTVAEVNNKIIEDADFNKGGNLLFMSFDKNISNIETKNPYVKVEKIVRYFPNRITIYYSEREPVARVKVKNTDDAYFVVDSDLKVLDVVGANPANYNLPIVNVYNESYSSQIGHFIADSALQSRIDTLVTAAYSGTGVENALYEDVMGPCANVTYYDDSSTHDHQIRLTFPTANEYQISATVYDADNRTYDKLALLWKVYIEHIKDIYTPTTEEIIKVDTLPSGKIVVIDETRSIEWDE